MFDNAFIGYDNLFTQDATTLSAAGVSTDFSVQSLKNWQPWDYCQFDAGSNSITIDCISAQDIDYFAIGGHELFTTGATTITLKASSNNFSTSTTLATISISGTTFTGSYALDTSTSIPSQTVTDNNVTIIKLDSVNYRYFKLEFNNTSECKIGILAIGQRMEFELGFYRDAMPPSLNEDIVVTNNKSESGIYLGRSVVRTGAKQQTINLDKISHSWIYNTWLPFKQSAELNPFFYSWGNTPLYNNQLCYQTSFAQTKLQDRIGTGHGSVGITFEGVIK